MKQHSRNAHLDSRLHGYIARNRSGNVVVLDPGIGRIVQGLQIGDRSETPLVDLYAAIVEEDRARVQAEYEAVEETGAPLVCRYGIRDRDGMVRPVTFRGTWTFSHTGEPETLFGILEEDEPFGASSVADQAYELAAEIYDLAARREIDTLAHLARIVMIEIVEQVALLDDHPNAGSY